MADELAAHPQRRHDTFSVGVPKVPNDYNFARARQPRAPHRERHLTREPWPVSSHVCLNTRGDGPDGEQVASARKIQSPALEVRPRAVRLAHDLICKCLCRFFCLFSPGECHGSLSPAWGVAAAVLGTVLRAALHVDGLSQPRWHSAGATRRKL